MVRELGYAREEWDWLPRSVHGFWRRATAPAERRIVWTSSRSADQHSAFLAWIERIGEQQYEVVDVADIEITRRRNGRSGREPALSLGLLDPDIIAAEALWDYARPLAPDERKAHAEAWRKLRAENAALRIIGPDGLRSAPITYFDNSLLSQAGRDWCKAMRLVAGTLMDDDGQYFQSGVYVLAARLLALIEAGKLEGRSLTDESACRFGSPTHPCADAEVRLAGA